MVPDINHCKKKNYLHKVYEFLNLPYTIHHSKEMLVDKS